MPILKVPIRPLSCTLLAIPALWICKRSWHHAPQRAKIRLANRLKANSGLDREKGGWRVVQVKSGSGQADEPPSPR